MKKASVLFLFIAVFSLTGFGQRKMQQLDEEEAKKQEQLKAYEKGKSGFDPDKLTFGGNFGGGFTSSNTYILLQPLAGYYIKPKTIPGLGFNYIYQSVKSTGVTYTSSSYGPIVFLRQGVLGNVFLHTEYSPMNYQLYFNSNDRVWVQQLFVGGGLGGRGGQVFILYNLLQDQSPFVNQSPWYIRIGFML